ncbi:hypothetical protein C0992_008236, partial [Termitomyces sp. T32_za158]
NGQYNINNNEDYQFLVENALKYNPTVMTMDDQADIINLKDVTPLENAPKPEPPKTPVNENGPTTESPAAPQKSRPDTVYPPASRRSTCIAEKEAVEGDGTGPEGNLSSLTTLSNDNDHYTDIQEHSAMSIGLLSEPQNWFVPSTFNKANNPVRHHL